MYYKRLSLQATFLYFTPAIRLIMPSPVNKGGFTVHNKVQVIPGGAAYFSYIEEMAGRAQYCIHLQTYIFDADETGRRVADALMHAAKRGVHVHLLVDGYASQHLPSVFIKHMKEAGVRFSFFNPFFKSNSYYIGRRLHHKVFTVDGRYCMVAGINISNRYNDIGDTHAWLDWAICAEGEVARQLNDICVQVWNRSLTRRRCVAINYPAYELPAEECLVRVRRNDWVFTQTEITKTYRELLATSKEQVVMMTSYFWPPQKLLRRMKAASKRGVKISVILTARADVPLSKYAERYLYSWLFRNRIDIYEYRPNVLHGKLAVSDGQWLTAGSYNVNNISAYASVELNLDVRNASIAEDVQNRLQRIITHDCIHITESDFLKQTNWLKKLAYYLSYVTIHLIFYVFTFYFIQKRERH